jgi:hypothetical protein
MSEGFCLHWADLSTILHTIAFDICYQEFLTFNHIEFRLRHMSANKEPMVASENQCLVCNLINIYRDPRINEMSRKRLR